MIDSKGAGAGRGGRTPTRGKPRRILSPLRLPVPPSRLMGKNYLRQSNLLATSSDWFNVLKITGASSGVSCSVLSNLSIAQPLHTFQQVLGNELSAVVSSGCTYATTLEPFVSSHASRQFVAAGSSWRQTSERISHLSGTRHFMNSVTVVSGARSRLHPLDAVFMLNFLPMLAVTLEFACTAAPIHRNLSSYAEGSGKGRMPRRRYASSVLESGAGMVLSSRRSTSARSQPHQRIEFPSSELEIIEMAEGLCVWSCNLAEGRLVWTPKCRSLFGFSPDALVTYESLRDAVHPEDRKQIDDELNRAIRERSGYDIEFRVRWPDGSLHWVMAKARVICDSEGVPFRLTGVDMDITERKHADAALREAQHHLAEAQRRAHLGIAVRVLPEKKVFWSDEAYRLLGYEPGTVEPSRELLLKGIHPEDRPRMVRAIKKAEAEGTGDAFLFRVIHPNGTIRILQGQGGAILDDSGRPAKLFATAFDVTEREIARAELEKSRRALKESESKFSDLFNQAAVGLAQISPGGRWLEVNQRLCEILGYSRGELLQRNIQDSVYPADRDHIPFANLDLSATRTVELRCVTKNGAMIWLNLTVASAIVSPDSVPYFVVVFEDVTEVKRTQAELSDSARLFSSVVEYSPLPILIESTSEPRHLILLNRKFEELFGYKLRDVRNAEHFWTQCVPDASEREEILRALDAPLVSAYGYEPRTAPVECEVRRKDGSLLTVEAHQVKAGGLLILTLVNRTARRKAEKVLLQSQRVTEALIANVPISLAMLDSDMRYVRVSKAWASETEFSPEELIGRSHYEVFPNLPDHWKDAHRRGLAGETVVGEDEWNARDGSVRTLRWSIHPWGNEAGQCGGIVIMSEDVSAIKQTESALIKKEKLASIGRMAATLAHEINNPLAAITNAIFIASNDPGVSAQTRNTLEMAQRELTRIAQLTRQTSAFYGDRAGPELIRLSACIDRALEIFATKLTEISVEKDYARNDYVLAAEGEIQQIISNLLRNAIEAAGKQKRIRLRTAFVPAAKGQGGSMRATIADYGIGISHEHLQRIFEPFFTTKQTVGNGLGMWIAQELANRQNAHIRVRSQVGRGTVVSVYFNAPDLSTAT